MYVNPATGVDASGRGSATAPLKTFGYAFYRIPAYRRLTRGYKILIAQVKPAGGEVQIEH